MLPASRGLVCEPAVHIRLFSTDTWRPHYNNLHLVGLNSGIITWIAWLKLLLESKAGFELMLLT